MLIHRQVIQIGFNIRHCNLRHIICCNRWDFFSFAAGFVFTEKRKENHQIARIIDARQRRCFRRDTTKNELMAKNVTFKAEAVRLLQQADADAYAPLKAQIDAAVQKVGKVKGLAFILNTDKGAFPYVNALCGEDVTLLIKENLK